MSWLFLQDPLRGETRTLWIFLCTLPISQVDAKSPSIKFSHARLETRVRLSYIQEKLQPAVREHWVHRTAA
jgi:hypothetical protein